MSKEDDLQRMLGEPKAAIRNMILPFLIALAVVEVNQFVDTYWVSGLGVKSASAISTIVPIYGLMTCAGLGVAAGVTATVAARLASSPPHPLTTMTTTSFASMKRHAKRRKTTARAISPPSAPRPAPYSLLIRIPPPSTTSSKRP